ncbi:hypothetical protein AV656_03575 [Bhargavaea cecembensis]|uniref:DUF4179 domain-containing protein n=1 Tax=Bhargavaea cecembensis TaxID=394098 RepID=A0A161SKL3_9BACL|nr:DUF4179 domain-containing protein [Bhargavaea cecembensis]KZE38023.1 hypothetical protein AV656_03575 [Bhargavaea cecembensis]
MTEREEQRLESMKERLDNIPIPEEALSTAIRAGVRQAEQERNRKRPARRLIWPAAAVAVLLLAFVMTIRVSPAFAHAVSSLPGMSLIVDLIQDDKGLKAIMDNEYYEEVHSTDSDGTVTVTLNGVIVDQSGMVISYTVDSTTGMRDPDIEKIDLFSGSELLEPQGISFNYPSEDGSMSNEQLIHYNFAEPLQTDIRDFELKLTIRDAEEHLFSLPFTVQNPIAEGKVYELNRTVSVDGQKLTIESITVHPLKVAIRIKEDPDNQMDILQYEDLRIEDGNGEVWSRIINGMTATQDEDGTDVYFLQSNYFEQPDLMSLRMNRMQAIDKTERLVVDTLTGEVLETPSDGKLEVTELSATVIETKLKTGPDFGYGYLGNATDANGKRIDLSSGGYWQIDHYSYNDLRFTNGDYVNPITVEFFAYPNYIEGDVTIRLE